MPIDNNLVKQLIAQIEVEQAERATLLSLLRKQIGETTSPSASPVNKKDETVSSEKQAAQPEKPNYRLNGSSDPNFVPIATRAIEVLREAGKALPLRGIVVELGKKGVDTSKKNFSTSLYTAMVRRSNDLHRANNGEWSLTEWKQKEIQPTINYGNIAA